MRWSVQLLGNLNKPHWNRRVWEIGYRGSPLPAKKATGQPNFPVRPTNVASLRRRLLIEHNVMLQIAKPYLSKEVCTNYFASEGVSNLDELKEKNEQLAELRKMPGKPKITQGAQRIVMKNANVGNNLHQHATIEDSLKALLVRNRWD
ncbi:hypothetical protein WR25_01294 isoform A [Diploscapter pachys]|uniref:Uncharacterized protein n=1 Tax=Diploscapter pachys TaxID=2018661 RepID=A0A2A2J3J1_9BILA|nr:hypothetical protein WR25_01294 isoform A [Diploscapter pachys]